MNNIPLSPQPGASEIYLLEHLSLKHHVKPAASPRLKPRKLLSNPVLLPEIEVTHSESPVYNSNFLKLLDDLQCPVLLLPRVKKERSIKRIGFFTDILFTGTATLALLMKTAKSLHAKITVFNIPEPALPEMDPGYAERYFAEQGMSKIDGSEIKLVNLKKVSETEAIEDILEKYEIDLVAATQRRKDLLYRLVS
jgi:hypothetical protein